MGKGEPWPLGGAKSKEEPEAGLIVHSRETEKPCTAPFISVGRKCV